jgi:hypothetical protein
MEGRCSVCGAVVNGVTICNSCRIASEERRFLKMVNREELNSTLMILNRRKKSRKADSVAQR